MTLVIPALAAELTPCWVSGALRADGHSVADVISLEVETVGAGSGLISDVSRLRLTYAQGGDGPGTVIAKRPSRVENTRVVADALGMYAREVRFYRHLASRTSVTQPRCYFAGLDDDHQNFVLLLEDLSDGRVVDQLSGCSPEDAELIVDRLAALHADWWNDPDLIDRGWVGRLCDSPFPEAVAFSFQQGWPIVRDRFADDLPPSIIALGDRFDLLLPMLMAQLSEPPYTLSHGDFRLDNMFLFDDSRDLAVCDWQLMDRSRGPRDLAYFMTQSLATADREAVERTLVERYVERLRSAGVNGYGVEDAWHDYRVASLFAFVYPVVAGGAIDSANERARDLISLALTRSIAAIMQLDCLDLVAS